MQWRSYLTLLTPSFPFVTSFFHALIVRMSMPVVLCTNARVQVAALEFPYFVVAAGEAVVGEMLALLVL
jgi:hypothetical protein